jgi:outer membrane protein
MKKNLVILLFLGLLAPGYKVFSQEQPASLSLTVEQAVEYALKNNKSIESARYDLLASEKTEWEAYAAGLPSLGGTVGFTDNIVIPTIVFNGMSFKMGTNYNLSGDLSGSALLFNAPYLVGIQTAKLATVLSQQGLRLSEIETKESVISAYYIILITEETNKILEANLNNMNELLTSTKAMFKVGMAESTDVDQMASTVATLENSLSSMHRTIEVSYNLLRFLLGLDRNIGLSLTDSIDTIVLAINMDSMLNKDFDINQNISYQMVESMVKMSELSLKGTKSSVLPSLAVGYSLARSGMSNYMDSLSFSNSAYVAVQMSIPIFASGLRNAQIQKAKINLEKSKNNQRMVEEQLLIQEKQLRYNLISSNEQYMNQKNNIELANRVLQSFQNKYSQGMASSLDLTQANNNYLVAQSNYLSALMNLLQNKIAFDKLMNNL